MSASLADQACSLAVALGANRPSVAGSPRQTLIHVRPELEALMCDWTQTSPIRLSCSWSPLLETLPEGGPPGQPMFCNAVLLIRGVPGTPGLEAALALLDRLQVLEAKYGRDRDREERWGPRSLDLDLLFWGDWRLEHPRLVLPHPRLHLRSFVMEPLLAAMQRSTPWRS
ncbi:2-amino-4-hydroxy-6- hydroxymethyldihydropteridine diphosphokinase [Synechococcus sp. A18-25c]|uniref:2-amino-4-hydroxy-6- hydroxymethyldihydropteridine diphosphokinase n=1 Tax=Synechococcus sp. A18-25c TaxID=1866938 RepID=UPI001645CAFB|nr:2-amino-4-hydroxy-6-hydroxymethyldihydropteridine diphosphokinase [Synechococcus sp. A18-25c]QNJ18592.1 2-amino-4-hydroxy-6- hydroxymethyldihydropteridine diphosphokinase [Synechococcus sp. A18-25c]